MDKYSGYEYDVYKENGNWVYKIWGGKGSYSVVREYAEWFDSRVVAEREVVRRINSLESGIVT